MKYVLKVYISDDDRKFIDRAAAYALGFINVRAIMLRDEPNLFEITEEQIKQVQRKNYEIEYHELKVKESPKKLPLQIFEVEGEYYIKPSTAYALNLISVENFYAMQDDLYKINSNLLTYLSNKYDIENITSQKGKSK